uniref:Longin domain-containing protein n=1 Tax=Tetraselmis chuii TaxID=63592 RepID=A0A6U1I5Q4_9CHLO
MVRLTIIARVTDGLPLAEGLESDKSSDLEQYKQQAKTIIKKLSLSQAPPSRMSYESGPCFFHYIIEGGVCFLTLAERGYPKKLAYQYLEELQSEFTRLYGTKMETVARPYAFIKFDTFIQKTRKLYLDTRTQRNLAKLSEDIAEVHNVMTKNIQEVLTHGERLENMTQMSGALGDASRGYRSKAKEMERQAFIRKYLPVVVVGGVILFALIFRWTFYR